MSTLMEPEYGSQAWQAERSQYIGASEMPMACGESPYGGPLTLVRQKLGLDVVEQNHAMVRGHIYEPAILAEFCVLHPEYSLGKRTTTRHPRGAWLRATPDAIASGPHAAIVEAKMVHPSQRHLYGESGSPDVPFDKQIQCQVLMDVFAVQLAIVVVNFGFETREYYLEADRATQEHLFEIGHDLWHRHVLTGILPEPNLALDTYDAIQRTLNKTSDKLITADVVLAAKVTEFGDVKRAKKAAEEREEALKSEIALAIGHGYGVDAGEHGRVLWPESAGKTSIDTAALIRDLNVPDDVVQRYTRRGAPYRSMRYYPPKGGK